MNQLSLFAAAPIMARPIRPETALLLAMSHDYRLGGTAPPFTYKPAEPQAKPDTARGVKLRDMADSLQKSIDQKFANRETNTPKRQREAGNARNEGIQLERAQKIMRALADLWESGDVPELLRNVKTKVEICDHAREGIDHRGGYYDSGTLTGKPHPCRADNPVTLALWALLDAPTDPARAQAEDLRRKVEALQFANIPGYFPTPPAVRQMMFEAARLDEGQSILEPSAGSGAIADDLRTRGYSVDCIEHWHSLREILQAKGHAIVHDDFLTFTGKYDRIIMNPPFEKCQDVRHVRHAFEQLKPGGRLVAIMSAGVNFRSDCERFRQWVYGLGGEFTDIAAGAFKSSGTGVATVMLVLDRD